MVGNKKKSSIGTVFILVFLLILVVMAFLYLLYSKHPLSNFKWSITTGDYAKAIRVYNEELNDPEDLLEAYEFLSSKVDEIVNNYINDNISYTTVFLALKSIEDMYILTGDEIENARAAVEELNESRIAFSSGELFFQEGLYEKAISEYKKVILKDLNYGQTQKRIAESMALYKEAVLKQAAELHTAEEFIQERALLVNALEILTNDVDVSAALKASEQAIVNQKRDELVISAKKKADEKRYMEAIYLLESGLSEFNNDPEFIKLILHYKELHKETRIAEADRLVSENRYQDALDIVSGINKEINEEQDYTKKIEEIYAKWKAYAKANQTVEAVQSVYRWSAGIFNFKGQLHVTIKNNSSSDIAAVTLAVLHYNSDNKPCEVNVTGRADQTESFSHAIESVFNNVKIGPNKTGTVTVDLHTVSRLNANKYDFDPALCQGIACVKSVTFSDGTILDNEYYPFWIEEYKGKDIR